MEWQPIETAPEGQDVLIFVPLSQRKDSRNLPDCMAVATKGDEMWEACDPTHWMPLPPNAYPPPEPASQSCAAENDCEQDEGA